MKFRKKPVVIDAVQFTGKNEQEIADFMGLEYVTVSRDQLLIGTKEGMMAANVNDWVVKGYSSQLGWHYWPVKPDYMEENYEAITE